MKSLTKNLLEELLRDIDEGLLVLVRKESEWKSVFFNPAFVQLSGLDPGQLSGQSLPAILEKMGSPDEWPRLEAALSDGDSVQQVINRGRPEEAESSLLLRLRPVGRGSRRSDTYYACYLSRAETGHRPAGGQPSPAELMPSGDHRDAATGLVPRQFFDGVLARDWSLAQRERRCLSLLIFRIDAFPAYLDTFGRHATESMLRRVSRCITRRLRRGSDLAARLEEDCIVALVHHGDEDAIRSFANSISQQVKALGIHHPHSPVARFVTVQAMVATASPTPESSMSEFVQKALSRKGV